MAGGGLHFASVLEIDSGDYVVLDNLMIEVTNTPRHEIEGGLAKVCGLVVDNRDNCRVKVTTGVGVEQLIPRLDDDFNLEAHVVEAGTVLYSSEWPDLPVICVDLALELLCDNSFGNFSVEYVSGFYVRRSDGDGTHHVYTSLDGKSVLDASEGDRIIAYRAAGTADFIAAGVI